MSAVEWSLSNICPSDYEARVCLSQGFCPNINIYVHLDKFVKRKF